MPTIQAFQPAGTATLVASNTNASVALAGAGDALLIYNASAAVAFVQPGLAGTVATAATGTPIPPGARMLMQVGILTTTLAAILSTGTGNIYASLGVGSTY